MLNLPEWPSGAEAERRGSSYRLTKPKVFLEIGEYSPRRSMCDVRRLRESFSTLLARVVRSIGGRFRECHPRGDGGLVEMKATKTPKRQGILAYTFALFLHPLDPPASALSPHRPLIDNLESTEHACTQPMAAKRRLYLHESALSHAEYTQYVESFDELVEGDRSHSATVSVPEARGWLKGRYAANNTVDAATIDKVLQISLSPAARSDRRSASCQTKPNARVNESADLWLSPIPSHSTDEC